jgi:hypothetical protein
MFTWICPQCGREVPPAYTECPDCTKKTQSVTAAPPPSSLAYRDPAPAAPVEPPAAELKPLIPPVELPPVPQPPVYIPQPAPVKRGFPVWLAFVLSTLAVAGIVAGVYWAVNHLHGGSSGSTAAAQESPGAKPGTAVSPLQKFIEISSVRFLEDPKSKAKVLVKFVLTNHSETELRGLAGNVTIWASTGRSEEDAEGTFEFKTDVKGLDSKELTAPLTGKKKIYELPDWQNMTNDVQVTAPTS